MKGRMNIGSTSLILIFIVLCLATFGLLSLSSAKGDWNLAQKGAASALIYYQADREGENFLEMADKKLQEAFLSAGSGDVETALEVALGDYYRKETGTVETDIPMEYGQVLHIELRINEGGSTLFEISEWKVFNQDEYEIDDSMPVWTGV
ncbi:hypothetical protein GPL15_13690 [Clostridium sp. MCC353]|uniref:hypothetical protein n=1 Tax=Clostridium sp. MCC353 TaxID=2592646 RepID=UPI001C027D28|nr:hypothetical protein [Clostridium sp. MCC353]MBT9777555.1 hypothetical protein [Clostridium sp. MCC353]